MVHDPDPARRGARPYRPRRSLPADVAEMLAAARHDLGLSVREAARRCGVTPGTIIHLEHGRRVPSILLAEGIIEGYRLAGHQADRLRDVAVTDAGRSSPFRGRY